MKSTDESGGKFTKTLAIDKIKPNPKTKTINNKLFVKNKRLIIKIAKNAFIEYISETMLNDHIDEVNANIKTQSVEHTKINNLLDLLICCICFSPSDNK